ncbi:MAG: hypothetical protein KF817_12545 [Phycisphaeraceae bacterium]|nr:hypothetical protein [Phycisphaeraceae bacterium]
MPAHRTLRFATAALILGSLAACQTAPPENRGTSGYRLDPTHDADSELGRRAPRSADLVEATDRMAQDIARRIDITNWQSPPRIVLGRIENHSTLRDQNWQVFLARLRSQLQSSSAREGLDFFAERARVERFRDQEYGGKDPASSSAAYRSEADYMLVCEVYDLPSGGTNYFLFNYQLVQLREAASGPQRRPGEIVWENSYEVKFQ